MNKEWQKSKEEWYQSEILKRKEIIINGINSNKLISDDKKKELIDKLNNEMKQSEPYSLYSFCLDLEYGFFILGELDEYEKNRKCWKQWIKDIELDKFRSMIENKSLYDGSAYLDSEPMEFDGDIIITDPCYIMKERDESDKPTWSNYQTSYNLEMLKKFQKDLEEWNENHPSDWDVCNCGENMEALGINTYMTRDTIYGDWSCTTFNTDTEEAIGEFCADAGLVSVFLLDEVLKYNPEFDYHINRPWTTTWIKDFKGTVQFVVVYTDGYYEDDTTYHKKGDHWEDYSVQVVGHGVNKVTGEPINFVGKQTGL